MALGNLDHQCLFVFVLTVSHVSSKTNAGFCVLFLPSTTPVICNFSTLLFFTWHA